MKSKVSTFFVINSITTASIYLDDEYVGTLEKPVDGISGYYEDGTITKEVSSGQHTCLVLIHAEKGALI
ncbi:hypothetical protein LJC68_05875 [Bacteroidales bacterium OttesenSCG-928-B11]|nr:hypothetical protein [Bacteroidales bacterium OttesenSCG-928-C03]MDL2312386.1 hypothetical protein [Bacteroidales bacterium OttesenSCG-928-B11]MDL2326642.1 hypothetical protein [Bacteroidales bacterium OttesenSCG-928-A14]